MKLLKPALIIALVLSVALNLYLVVKIIDAAITLEHHGMELKYQVRSSDTELEILSQVLTSKVTRQEMIDIADQLATKGVIVKKRDGFIELGRLEISFDGDKIVNVKKF